MAGTCRSEDLVHPQRTTLRHRALLYNALRLANALVKKDPVNEVTVFLMADVVSCGKKGQKTPDGYYNLERSLKRFATGVHKLLLCGTCMDARGLTEPEFIDGARRSSMDKLAAATGSSFWRTTACQSVICPCACTPAKRAAAPA